MFRSSSRIPKRLAMDGIFVLGCLLWAGVHGKGWMLRSEMLEAVINMRDSFRTNFSLAPIIKGLPSKVPENTTFNVLVHEMRPYTYYSQRSGEVFLSGYIGEIWKTAERSLGVKSVYRVTDFRGGKNILREGGADIMLSPVILESKDFDYFNSFGPVANTVYKLYTMNTEDNASPWSYLWTWSFELWLSYLSVLVLCTLFLWLMTNMRVSVSEETIQSGAANLRKTLSNKNTSVKLSLGQCFLVIWGSATQQGVPVRTKVCSLRILLIVLIIFNSLMQTSYNSVLVSRLTVSLNSRSVTDLESIAEDKNNFLCVRLYSAVYSRFTVNSSSPELSPIWKSKVNKGPCHPAPLTTADVATNLCKENTILFESQNIMMNLISNLSDCTMIPLITKLYFSQIDILTRKDFMYTRLLRLETKRMKDNGILNVLENRFIHVRSNYQSIPRYQEVTLGHIKALIYLYGSAAGVSLLLLALEFIVYHKIRKRD